MGKLFKNIELIRKKEKGHLNKYIKSYLTHFGYMRACSCDDTLLCKHTEQALAYFQTFSRLEVTGSLTLETLKQMKKPRCPLPDFSPDELGGPGIADSDPFVFSSQIWNTNNLRWYLLHSTTDMTGEAAIIQQAFDVWAQYIPLNFTRTYNQNDAHFTLSWETGDHGDGSPFDGTGSGGWNVFAHAFYPRDGRIHFDDGDNWGTSHGGGKVDLLSVAIHEIGHALGLGHSGNSKAVMYYAINEERRHLHEVDIKGIKSRYPFTTSLWVNDFITIPLWALKNEGGCGTRTIDLGREVRIVAWGHVTMADSLNDFDRDNAYAVEVYEIDGDRPGPYVWGGDHWGSDGAPSNVYTGAWTGKARRVTFRISSLHSSDLDTFGTGNIIILD